MKKLSNIPDIRQHKITNNDISEKFTNAILLIQNEMKDLESNESDSINTTNALLETSNIHQVAKVLTKTRVLNEVMSNITHELNESIQSINNLYTTTLNRYRPITSIQQEQKLRSSAEYNTLIENEPLDNYSKSLQNKIATKYKKIKNHLDVLHKDIHIELDNYQYQLKHSYQYNSPYYNQGTIISQDGIKELQSITKIINSNVSRINQLKKHMYQLELLKDNQYKKNNK